MTPAQRILRRLEKNKLVSFAMVIGIVVIALASFTKAVQELGGLFFPHRKPRVTLEQVNSDWKRGKPAVEESYRPLPQKLQQRFDHEIKNLLDAGFAVAGEVQTYRVGEPTTIKLMVPVTETSRYAIVACGNASISGVRAALFDELGNLLDSDEGDRKVSVKQSSDYTGTIQCFIEVRDVDAVGQINIATARRSPREQRNSKSFGVEPTFDMESSSPADSPPPLRH